MGAERVDIQTGLEKLMVDVVEDLPDVSGTLASDRPGNAELLKIVLKPVTLPRKAGATSHSTPLSDPRANICRRAAYHNPHCTRAQVRKLHTTARDDV